jgi:hypothetical protein
MAGTTPEEFFQKVLARLREDVVIGKAHLRIGQGLGQKLAADPVLAQVARVFWGTTMNAHLDAAQLRAFKLFDSRNGTMTLEYLLTIAEDTGVNFRAHPERLPELFDTCRAHIASVQGKLEPLRAKRNRIIAHSEPTIVTDPEKLAKLTTVTFADLNDIFSSAGRILNEVTVAYSDAFSDYDLLDVDDYTWALQLIADAKHDFFESYERDFGKPDFARPTTPRSMK